MSTKIFKEICAQIFLSSKARRSTTTCIKLSRVGAKPGGKRWIIPLVKNRFINLTRRQHKFLYLEQVTIAEWQSASEDQKFVVKPTQSNMNLFVAIGTTSRKIFAGRY